MMRSTESAARNAAYMREKRRNFTAEQRDAHNAWNAEWRRKNHAAVRNAARTAYRNMSTEQKKLVIKTNLDRQKSMTPEQKEKRNAASRKRRKANREKENALMHTRRARLRGSSGSYTDREWKDLVKKWHHQCAWCGRPEPEIKLTVDHVIPISRGGLNVISNIQPLCLSCNSRKNARDLRFIATGLGMKDEDAKQLNQILGRIALSLERLADHFAPEEKKCERRPATLSTATYSREERERQELRKTLSGTAPQPAGGAASPTRSDL